MAHYAYCLDDYKYGNGFYWMGHYTMDYTHMQAAEVTASCSLSMVALHRCAPSMLRTEPIHGQSPGWASIQSEESPLLVVLDEVVL